MRHSSVRVCARAVRCNCNYVLRGGDGVDNRQHHIKIEYFMSTVSDMNDTRHLH